LTRRAFRSAALGATLFVLGAGPAHAAGPRACAHAPHFLCSTIQVPLDRTGTVPGKLAIHFAAQNRLKHSGKVLLALTGGPGQSGIGFGPGFAEDLRPALRHYRLVVMDQRGTGGSNVLNCPEVQALDALAEILSEDVAACARRLGPQRDSYASVDTADDIEAIRQALGVPKIAIYGVSYGTWVAQQYARRYPDHVDRLILDSIVPPDNDPWDLRITRALPRVLRGLCARGACKGITADPVADLDAVVAKIQAEGALSGNVRGINGGLHRESLTEYEFLSLLVASDLNPWMQARLPGAMAAARGGDLTPLLRMRRDAAGPPEGQSELSAGLFVDTTCLDQPLPFSYSDSFDVRAAKAADALAALPAADFAPFDRETIDRSSATQICLHWPDGTFRPEETGPLPDVPTLVLSGLADLRTPMEGALTVAQTLPHAQVVTLAGSGHSVLTADVTGCVDRSLARFFANKAVNNPCRGRDDSPRLAGVPPRRLADVAPTSGIPGPRGRVVRAAVATVGDAWTTDNESLYAGFQDASGGGLRSGRFGIIPTGSGDLLLMHRMVYVPGVRVDGAVVASSSRFTGRLRVFAGHLSGTLKLRNGRVTGRIGGHAVAASFRAVIGATIARVAGLGYDQRRMADRRIDRSHRFFRDGYAYAYAWRFR
jgi:pimeloyl-ACP methyl ester carboxylesterase